MESTTRPSAPARSTVLTPRDIEGLPVEALGGLAGVAHRILWQDATSMAGVLTVLAGHRLGLHTHRINHHHLWVLDGHAVILGTRVGPGSYAHVPSGVEHDIDATTTGGCTVFYLYIHPGGEEESPRRARERDDAERRGRGPISSRPVSTLVSRPPVAIDERLTLRQVAAAFSAQEVGAALVDRPDGTVAIVTERDLTRALADDADPDVVWSADVMTQDVVGVQADEPILGAALRLADAGVRHLAVLDGQRVVGLVSSRDLLQALAEGTPAS